MLITTHQASPGACDPRILKLYLGLHISDLFHALAFFLTDLKKGEILNSSVFFHVFQKLRTFLFELILMIFSYLKAGAFDVVLYKFYQDLSRIILPIPNNAHSVH